MKLLIVTTLSKTLASFLLPYAEYFRRQGYRVDAVSSDIENDEKCRKHFNEVTNINWSRNPFHLKNFYSAVWSIKKLVREKKYDIVHVHTPIAAFLTRFALRKIPYAERPIIIYTAHGFHFHSGGNRIKNYVFKALEKIAGKWTDYLIVINEEDEKAAKRYELLPVDRIIFMPGIGIDVSYYDFQKVFAGAISDFRAKIGLKKHDILFLMIAEFNPGKRHEDLINAFSRIEDSSVHLAFAGNGKIENKIKKKVKQLGLETQIHFLGYCMDIRICLASSKALVLPSEREGLPRSILESMCMGKPIIGSNIRGIDDLLRNGAGILVEVGDIKALKKAISTIKNNPFKAQRMGLIGREQIMQYNITNLLEMHSILYKNAKKRCLSDPLTW